MINILAVTGVSGSGKSYFAQQLHDDKCYKLFNQPTKIFNRITQVTTRTRRTGEDPAAYHFVSDEEFKQLVAEDKLTAVTKFYDHSYGTPLNLDSLEETFNVDNNVFLIVVNAEGYWDLKELADEYPDRIRLKTVKVEPVHGIPYKQRKGRDLKKVSEESLDIKKIPGARICNGKKVNWKTQLKNIFLPKEKKLDLLTGRHRGYIYKTPRELVRELMKLDSDWEDFLLS